MDTVEYRAFPAARIPENPKQTAFQKGAKINLRPLRKAIDTTEFQVYRFHGILLVLFFLFFRFQPPVGVFLSL